MWRSGVVDDQIVSRRLTRLTTFHPIRTRHILLWLDGAGYRPAEAMYGIVMVSRGEHGVTVRGSMTTV